MPEPKYQISYWPIPFRGCFVSYLFAYRDVPLDEVSDLDLNKQLLSQAPSDQPIPVMGLPVLQELDSGRTLSQTPAIILYVSRELDLLPADSFNAAICTKILMDCNDLLMEICRNNGATMWTHEEWRTFRTTRLVRWMQIFEESLNRQHFGNDSVTFADIAVYALFGNMTRCLPALDADLIQHAPQVHAFCEKIGRTESLARFVAHQQERYGDLYCGGQIEQSIRKMIQMDTEIR